MKKIFLNSILVLGGIISSFNLISCNKKEEISVSEGYKFYTLRQEKIVNHLYHFIKLEQTEDATFLKQFFYIYDEKLGTLTKENMDVIYFSMQFNCRFTYLKTTN